MSSAVTSEQVEQVVTESLISFGAEPGQLNREATFVNLAIDSLDMAEMAQIVDERFGVQLTSKDVTADATVGDLIDLIAARA